MKTIAVKYIHLIPQGEMSRLGFACQTAYECNAYHKTSAIQPLVSFLSPFISRFIQAGIYFALDSVRPILPGTTSHRPPNRITGEE